MKVRILRLIEYIYDDAELAAKDRLNWIMNHNTGSMQIRSAVLPWETITWEENNSPVENKA